MSVAVIHEFLSHQESQVINILEVSQRFINQMLQGVLDPEKQISLDLRGPNVYLPARQATACAISPPFLDPKIRFPALPSISLGPIAPLLALHDAHRGLDPGLGTKGYFHIGGWISYPLASAWK